MTKGQRDGTQDTDRVTGLSSVTFAEQRTASVETVVLTTREAAMEKKINGIDDL